MRSYLVKKTNGGNMIPSLVQKTSSAKILFHQKKIRTLDIFFFGYFIGKKPQREIGVMVRILFEDLYEGHVDNREAFLISHLFD